MNPATEDILAAIQSVPAKTVFVLPNNKNIIMAAEQAQKLADRQVVVLPTRTVPMGITAMLNFDPSVNAETNTINMMAAADKVSTGLITYAARDSEYDGKRIKKGEIMALERTARSFHLQRHHQGHLSSGTRHVQEGFQLRHHHLRLRRER